MKRQKRTPKEWQTDPNNIKTDTVQFWSNGVMITAMMNKVAAQDAVNRGVAFVISDQAIGAMINGRMNS